MRTTTQGFISPALALQTVSHRSAVSAVMYTQRPTVVRRADLIILPPVVREIRTTQPVTSKPMAEWLFKALNAKPAATLEVTSTAPQTEWVGPNTALQIGRPRRDIDLRPKKTTPRKCRLTRNSDFQPGRRDHFERRALRQSLRSLSTIWGGTRG